MGGSFFLGNPSPGEGVAQNRVGTQIKRLFTVYNEFGGVQVYKITALEFTYYIESLYGSFLCHILPPI